MSRQCSTIYGLDKIKVWYFSTYQWIKDIFYCASTKRVYSLTFQFSCTGTTQDKVNSLSGDEPMYLVQQFGNELNLIDNNDFPFCCCSQFLPK